MNDYRSILGVDKNASEDEIKKAYRKLAQQHHPDKGGDEEKFKEIKEAYEKITQPQPENMFTRGRNQQGFTEMDEILRQMREAQRHAYENAVQMIEINVDITKAFNGCKIPIHAFGNSIAYELRAGLPQGVTFQDEVPVGDRQRRVQITLNIVSDKFQFAYPGTENGYFFSGDLITTVEVDAVDVITGGYVNVTDFLGKTLAVRIPAGFDPRTRLKVAKHGYSNWNGDKAVERGDLYIRVLPKFVPLKDVPEDKRMKLYNEIQALMPKADETPSTS